MDLFVHLSPRQAQVQVQARSDAMRCDAMRAVTKGRFGSCKVRTTTTKNYETTNDNHHQVLQSTTRARATTSETAPVGALEWLNIWIDVFVCGDFEGQGGFADSICSFFWVFLS